jgi:hypothetical protein
MVTDVFANARPTELEPVPVKATPDPARIFPLNLEPVPIVPSVPSAQYTLQACPPPAMTTWEVPVVRPVTSDPVVPRHHRISSGVAVEGAFALRRNKGSNTKPTPGKIDNPPKDAVSARLHFGGLE